MDKVIIAGCEFCSATGQCKIQQVFQRNEIVGIIEKPYGVHLECNLCDKNCYYKQLQRLKEESERIQRDFLKQNQWLQDQKKEIDELKAENERLKENDCEQCKHLDLYIKYKQTLQEIRNIAELEVMLDKNSKAFYPTNLQRILDKINEVIGAE